MNLDYFFAGIDTQAYKYMGCHKLGNDVEFYVWAPHARKVEVYKKSLSYDFKRLNEYTADVIIEPGEWKVFKVSGADN